MLLEVERRPAGAIEIVGDHGSGKTTALAHLAAMLPDGNKVVFLDDASIEQVREAATRHLVVYSSFSPRFVPEGESYRLAPWREDELIEYLVAVHPARCRSVMMRLQNQDERRLHLAGIPELWRIVLDRMAEDETLTGPRAALEQELERSFSDKNTRKLAAEYCLGLLAGDAEKGPEGRSAPRLPPMDIRRTRLLLHEPVQLLLAAEHLAGELETREGNNWLGLGLPRALVKQTAAQLSPAAVRGVEWFVAQGSPTCQAMGASLLHAAGSGWRPASNRIPTLTHAYLDGAVWSGIDLSGTSLEGADLDQSDLSEAILNGARAESASFREANLHRASLVKLSAVGAIFIGANLTEANARNASLRRVNLQDANLEAACLADANLFGADLSGARLVRADLSRAMLTVARLRDVDLSHANLSYALLERATLREACFFGTCFEGTLLNECDLEHAEILEADFRKAYLKGSRLTGSRMPKANFAHAILCGAGLAEIDWEQADLRGADLSNCVFHLGSSRSGLVNSPIACEGSRTGFYTDEFDQQSYCAPEEIRKANLRGADLIGANIEGTDFYLVDLRNANYTREQFAHFRRCGAILFSRA